MIEKNTKANCARLIKQWLQDHGTQWKKKSTYLNLASAFDHHPDCPPELRQSTFYRVNRRKAIFGYLMMQQHGIETPEPQTPKSRKRLSNKDFYNSDEWRRLRYRALVKYGRKCMVCGATPEDGKKMHVDHIKPRSKFSHLELVFSNLQVLCEDCNLGKSNLDEIDWRPQEHEHDLKALAELREKGLLN